MRDITEFFRPTAKSATANAGQCRSHENRNQRPQSVEYKSSIPVHAADSQTVGRDSRAKASSGHMQHAQHTDLNDPLHRPSNVKFRTQPVGLNSHEEKRDVVQSQKDDYRHWTHFVCSQADGVTADIPKVQYRLDEPLPGRQHASATAQVSERWSKCPQHIFELTSADPQKAAACHSMNASAVSEHTAEHLSSNGHMGMHSKVHSVVDLRATDVHIPFNSALSSRNVHQAAYEVKDRQQVEALHSTPPARAGGDCDICPTTILTLAASTPSTTWRTPGAGLDIAQSAADCDCLTSCMQDMTPVLTARRSAQALANCTQNGQERQGAPHIPIPDSVASPMAASPSVDKHAAEQASSLVDESPAGRLCADRDVEGAKPSGICGMEGHVSVQKHVTAPGTPTGLNEAASQTSSLYSDGIDEFLATLSSPEPVKRKINDQKCETLDFVPAAGSHAKCPCITAPDIKPGKGSSEQNPAGRAKAVVPAGRLDAQESAVVKNLLQWGEGGIAHSLSRERAMLLHEVVEVLRPEPGELRLLVLHISSKTQRWAHLYGGWADTEVSVGDTANLIVEQDQWVPAEDGIMHCVLDNGRGGLFVLHPDILISGTSISSALRCPRQALLQDRGVGSPSRAACLGTLMHELAQTAMLALSNDQIRQQHGNCVGETLRRPPPFPRRDGLATSVWSFMMDLIPKLVAGSVMQLTEVGLTQREAEHELRQASGQLAQTLASHFRQNPAQLVHMPSQRPKASIEGVLDIEESIWAPRFGLKGVIDATIISRTRQQDATNRPGGRADTFGVAALEFKSGKVYQDHAAQLGIYSLLLHSRYGTSPADGLLWYSRLEDMNPVTLGANDIAGLMMTRNLVAAYKARGAWILPPPLQSLHTCRSCMVLPLCAVAHHAMEGGTGDSFALPEQYAKLTEHLTQQDSEFFQHWLHLLETEQAEHKIPQSNIWALDPPPHAAVLPRGGKRRRASMVEAGEFNASENMSPNSQPTSQHGENPVEDPMGEEKEKVSDLKLTHCIQDGDPALQLSQVEEEHHPLVGRCIGSLIKVSFDGECSNLALYPFVYTFTQKLQSEESAVVETVQELLPLSVQGFVAGDCGILSVQDRHVAVNRVRVLSVTSTELKLALRSRLSVSLEALSETKSYEDSTSCCSRADLAWRLDKDEPETAFQCAISGLLELMVTQSAHAQRLRGLIVHHDAPQHSAHANYSNEVPVEEDCFQAMAESEKQQTLSQACISGTHSLAHVPATLVPRSQQGPITFWQQHPGWQRPISAPPMPQQPLHCGYPAQHWHSGRAGTPGAAQYQKQTSASDFHNAGGSGLANSTDRPLPSGIRRCHDRSSAPAHCGSGRWPNAVPQGQGWGGHTLVHSASSKAAPEGGLAIQPCHIHQEWAQGGQPAAHGNFPEIQQPLQQSSFSGAMQQCGNVNRSQRHLSAPPTHGHSGLPTVYPHTGADTGPFQLSGKTGGRGAAAPGVHAHACSPMHHAHSIYSTEQVLHGPRQSATSQVTPGLALTSEQQEVVDRALAWDDYVLVMGLPGAGKTYTIAACVQALVAQGRSVLLSAYTNAALDNMLRRVLEAGETRVLRVGRTDAVHPEVAPYVLRVQNTGTKAAALEIRKHVREVPIVGVTCLSAARAPLLRSRLFDVCILDEATQVTLPASLSPIMRSRTFVLVGDHLQLPPLVRSRTAQEGGLGKSLFKILSDRHPQAVVTLKAQHRMCAPIMSLSNELTYESRLRAATDAVAAARLCLPLKDKVTSNMPIWLRHVIARDPAVLWLDTRRVPAALDCRRCSSYCNPVEVLLTKQIIHVLLSLGADPADIGVTSPYNQQVRMLQNTVGLIGKGGSHSQVIENPVMRGTPRLDAKIHAQLEAARRVAVMTIDKFQGQDKASMVISLVRSNSQGHTGILLSDRRRINVALTRAKHKLVIIGNSDTLCNVSILKQAFDAVQRLGMTIDLTDSDIGM